MKRLELRGTDDDGYLAWVGGIGAEYSDVAEQFNALLDLLREAAPKCLVCDAVATRMDGGMHYHFCEEHCAEKGHDDDLGQRIKAMLE